MKVIVWLAALSGMMWSSTPPTTHENAIVADVCELRGAVFVETVAAFADYRIFIEDSEGFADLIVYKENSEAFANEYGHWYFTTNKGFADFTVFIEDVKGFADFSVAYTDFRTAAGCR